MNCKTCRYWETMKHKEGLCRALPPSTSFIQDSEGIPNTDGFWPVTCDWDWCGMYKAREPKAVEPSDTEED